ncbi:MAG: hypothetical protein JXA06_11130 [Bacteroidetes bacterium]|nr:hypothetical protein [Bacteroidota bacterium]
MIPIFTYCVNAQPKHLQFRQITTDHGLSNSWVHTVMQDKYGFIWIGTDDGLNRYDGYDFRIYKYNMNDAYSISNSNVIAILEDRQGNLWFGTREGLNLYDRENERFIRHPKLSQEEIFSIKEDMDSNLWMAGTRYLFRLDLKNDSLYTYHQDIMPQDGIIVSGGGNRKIIIDGSNSVWIASNYGLFLYNRTKDSLTSYFHDSKDTYSISSNDIYSIYEDKSGRIWIGTSAGLDLFLNSSVYPQKGTFVHYKNNINDKKSISKGAVLSLLEDSDRNLWIGIENGGLDIMNLDGFKPGNSNFVHYRNEPGRSGSLSHNSIYSLFQDRQGSIWIGTFGNGLNMVNPAGEKFIHIKSEIGVKNSLNNNQVHAFYEENDYLWIGTDGGLNRYDKKNGTYNHYVHDPLDNRSIGSNAVWCIFKDKSGMLWVGTWFGGLNRFDHRTGTFEHFYYNPEDTSSIGSNNIFSIFEDSDQNLWIGTMGGGLNLLDRKNKVFVRYNTLNSNIYSDYIQDIIESDDGYLWIANVGAFCCFDKQNKTFETFMHSKNDSTSLSSNRMRSILKDSKGNLWMGTNNGLNLFNKSTRRFKHYRTKDGLANNSINSIQEDKYGNLWIGTNGGLSTFANAVNLPEKPRFRSFTSEDGLQGNEFGRRSAYRNANGTLYFGGPNGFNIIDPDKVTENKFIPPVVISGFQIFNKPVAIGIRGLKNNEECSNDLILSYKQSVFSIDYSALNYIAPLKNQYAYIMEGFDRDWNYAGTKHSVTYTNLDPGKYIFRVKGSNNDGVWNEEGTFLSIVITPPFWRTKWFYGLIFLFTISAALGLYRWRVLRLLKHEKELNIRIQEALAKNRILSGLLPICSNCKKIRNDKGYWDQLEKYIQTHSEAQFTHGICPECAKKLYPDYDLNEEKNS